jgi:hypothetical protein
VTALNPFDGSYHERGTGCEGCHGPGRRHAETSDQTEIINPAILVESRCTLADALSPQLVGGDQSLDVFGGVAGAIGAHVFVRGILGVSSFIADSGRLDAFHLAKGGLRASYLDGGAEAAEGDGSTLRNLGGNGGRVLQIDNLRHELFVLQRQDATAHGDDATDVLTLQQVMQHARTHHTRSTGDDNGVHCLPTLWLAFGTAHGRLDSKLPPTVPRASCLAWLSQRARIQ